MFTKASTKRRDIRFQTVKPMQILDLLQLSRKENEYRMICRATIRRFDLWKKSCEKQKICATKIYWTIEGVLLRRQAQDAVLFYRLVRKDRVRKFREYISGLPDRKNFMRRAS